MSAYCPSTHREVIAVTVITSAISRNDMKVKNYENIKMKKMQDVPTGKEMVTFLSPMVMFLASALKK